MISRAMISVVLATVYLTIYCFLLQFDNTTPYAFIMFLFSPVVVIAMVYTVLRYDTYNGPSLGDREFGYQDKVNEELDVF